MAIKNNRSITVKASEISDATGYCRVWDKIRVRLINAILHKYYLQSVCLN